MSRDVTTPLSGTVCRPSAGTSYDHTVHKIIYEVSMLTHYEDNMKGDENAKSWVFWGVRGHPRSSETSPFDRAHMTSYSTLIENYTSILYRFRVVARFLSKVNNFNPPHLHLSPP